MGGTVIKAGATVSHCIVAENCQIEEGATVGKMPEDGLNIAEPGEVRHPRLRRQGRQRRCGRPQSDGIQRCKDGEEQW